MQVPFHLKRRPLKAPVAGLLLFSEEIQELLFLCDFLNGRFTGGSHEASLPPIYQLPGGFLIKWSESVSIHFPRTIRLRSLASDLFVPVDAELVPALFEEEARSLCQEQGWIFLPGNRVLTYAPGTPLMLAHLVQAGTLRASHWQPLPTPPPRPEGLRQLLFDPPRNAADGVLVEGGEGIGQELPRPEQAGTTNTVVGRTQAGIGQGMIFLGSLLGWSGLARWGARMVRGAVQRVPRLSEALFGRQEAALRELLRQFREGNLEDALRRALPLGSGTERRGVPSQDAHLPDHSTRYSLASLLSQGQGPASIWYGGMDLQAALAAEYRRAAEQATQRGDYRRAAFIYGRLLIDYRLAAAVLTRGGFYHDAAILYLEKLGDPLAASSAFEAGGEYDRALELYRQQGDHARAGDLLTRMGDEEAALAEYQLAASCLINEHGDYLGAGELLRKRAGRLDLARGYYRQGWECRPSTGASNCLLALVHLETEQESGGAGGGPTGGALLDLVTEARQFYDQPGQDSEAAQFYNELAHLADRPHLSTLRAELRDQALLGLAMKLRQRARTSLRPGRSASDMLGKFQSWAPSVVRDASHAFHETVNRRERRHTSAQVSRVRLLEERVTAVHASARTDALFVGFANGAVVCWVPWMNHRVNFPSYPWAVKSLTSDPSGHSLFILRCGEGEEGQLTCYHWEGDSYLAGPWRKVPVQESAALVGSWNGFVVLWDGHRFTQMTARELAPVCSLELPFDPKHFLAGYPLEAGPASQLIVVDEDSVWFAATGTSDPGQPDWVHQHLGFRLATVPFVGSASSSGSDIPPLNWLQTGVGELELAAVTPSWDLGWARLHMEEDRCEVQSRKRVWDGRWYRAVALLGPQQLVGVTSRGLDYIRPEEGHLRIKHHVTLDLPDVVSAHGCPHTNEVLLVTRGGEVIRVPRAI